MSTFDPNMPRCPGIVVVQVLDQLLWKETDYLLQKFVAKRVDVCLSNDTTVATDIDEGLVGDLVPCLPCSLLLEGEGGTVSTVEVRFEGRYGAHIEGREEEGSLGGEEEYVEHPFARRQGEGLDVASDFARGVGGESVHHKNRCLSDVLGDMVDVELHARDVHPFHWVFAVLAPPPTCVGSGLVGVCNEDGRNVNTVTSDG
jgi:hypothetical protein